MIESSNGLFLLLILSRDCKFAVTNYYNWCHKLIFVSWGVFFVKISICREESIEERGGGGIGGDQEMDYSLAALKLLRVQDTSETPSQNALTLGGILFQRAWLQGILVSNDGDGRLLLDDGTGVIELCLSPDFRLRHWDSGMYVMVVGGYFVRPGS